LFQNQEGSRLLGHGEIRSDSYHSYARYGAIHADGTPFRAEEYPMARALLKGEVIRGEEIRYRRGDNTETWLAVNAAPIFDLEGRVVLVVTTYTDILRRKLAEDALRAADRRKDEFLATLAHELRNPLAPIRNAVQLLRLRGPPLPELQNARDIIDRQVNQLVRLVGELLDLSRISTGRITLQMAPLDLRAAMLAAVESIRPLMEARGHQLTVQLPDQPVYVDGDPVRLTQVATNLLDNAAKYTPPEGEIALRVSREHGHAHMSVRDNGIGLAPDALTQIFEMFERVDTSAERLEGGLGIGLALVRKLVHLHGGTVHARSEGLGKGSEIIVSLPERFAPGASTSEAYTSAAAVLTNAPPCRVLVVDDNQDCAESMATLLELEGCTVRAVFSGEEALVAGSEFQPSVIFMDLGMPMLNGYETCKRLRAQAWGEDAFVVALTGWGQSEVRRMTEEAGFDLHLVKPLDPAQVGHILEAACQRS
jgi:signal transduction histidine kinase/CheY-like chemotaxis protein